MRTIDIMTSNGAPNILKGGNSEWKEKANLERLEELSLVIQIQNQRKARIPFPDRDTGPRRFKGLSLSLKQMLQSQGTNTRPGYRRKEVRDSQRRTLQSQNKIKTTAHQV